MCLAAAVKRRTLPQSALAAGNTNWPANGSEKGDDMYVLSGGQKKVKNKMNRVRAKRREKKNRNELKQESRQKRQIDRTGRRNRRRDGREEGQRQGRENWKQQRGVE